MTELERPPHRGNSPEVRMRLRYGVNQADECWSFARGPQRERILTQLREIDTRIIRLFLFDKWAPDPVTEWPVFASYVQAVLDVGAVPMITFAKCRRPVDDSRAMRWFAGQCADVVWGCIEQWGGQRVSEWYWCVWNEPNSDWIGGGLGFEQYRRIYEEVGHAILRWLGPYLDGRRPLIGGPAVESFQPFWMDWVWRFVNEIDDALIGFVDWHSYGDWREHGDSGAPSDGASHRALIISKTPQYEMRTRVITGVLNNPEILNICGELNAHSHWWGHVRARFNQSIFGATFYISALLHLIRGGADAEMFWVGTEDRGGYGMMDKDGKPWPVFYAKRLCAQYIRHGDWISFPAWEQPRTPVDVIVARGEAGRRSALLVHLKDAVATYSISALDAGLSDCRTLLKIDAGTGNQVVETACDGTLSFEGYGVAVLTNAPRGEPSVRAM